MFFCDSWTRLTQSGLVREIPDQKTCLLPATDIDDGEVLMESINTISKTLFGAGLAILIGLAITDSNQAQAQACVAPPAGLVAWWPGDGNTDDIVGGFDGTLENGAGFAAGLVGQAFDLNEADEFVAKLRQRKIEAEKEAAELEKRKNTDISTLERLRTHIRDLRQWCASQSHDRHGMYFIDRRVD